MFTFRMIHIQHDRANVINSSYNMVVQIYMALWSFGAQTKYIGF